MISRSRNNKVKRRVIASYPSDQLDFKSILTFSWRNFPFSFINRYIADAGARAILVHDCTENKSHRIVLPSAVVAGCNRPDVLYIALVHKSDGTNVLYFTYLCSSRLFSIKTEHLRNGEGANAIVDVGPKPNGQLIVLLGTDNGSSLFFRYKGKSDIFLWNTETCFKASNVLLVQKGGDCRLSTHVFPGHKKYMWTLESNFHDYINDNVGCSGASVVIHPIVKECEDWFATWWG